jgi:hypothetical protein
VDPGGEPAQTVAVAPADDQQALRARPVRRVLAAAILALLLAGGCARPAERDQTATATTAPSTTTPPTTAQDTEALRRAQLEVERFCMTRFPDHCAGVTLVTGQAATAIKVEPAGKQKQPSRRELAAFRKQFERLTGERVSDEELASFMKLAEQLPQPSPEQVAQLAARAGIPGFDLLGRDRLVVYRRPLAALDAAVRQRFPDLADDLRFADAAYSFRYLDELGRRILTEQLGTGVHIREVSPQPDGSGVRVVTPDARRVRKQLQQRYGEAVIVTEGP